MKLFVAAVLAITACYVQAADVEDLIAKNRAFAAEQNEVPKWKIAQEQEDAAIRARSFDRSTIGQSAYVFAKTVEDTIPRSAMSSILYRNMPCRLPIIDAPNMRAAESLYGRALVAACWGKVLSPVNDSVLIVTKFGNSHQDSLINYAEVKILNDGSGRFVKRAITPDEFGKSISQYQKELR
ncbi:hypothetical protein [Burkholderia sp. AU32262]|uniref:hypothetical protein n=1 Tax=Burkholderia sp. AU32262 TaxID=2879630 RepID=UPI001CF5D7C8|nr:hypothetical protein [Burkholderia sp. AU32262]MCA8242824.1 hypothetical protein [Burkholderia sp. AU32262]